MWTAAFGRPVLPVVNFQIAISSRPIGSGSRSAGAEASAASHSSSPASSSAAATPTARIVCSQGLATTASRTRSSVVRVGDHHPRLRVAQQVGEVLDREEGVGLGGHPAGLQRPVPGGDELGYVGEDQQHPLPGPQPRRAIRRGGAVGELGQLGEGDLALAADQRGPAAVPRLDLAVEDPLGDIELGRDVAEAERGGVRLAHTPASSAPSRSRARPTEVAITRFLYSSTSTRWPSPATTVVIGVQTIAGPGKALPGSSFSKS